MINKGKAVFKCPKTGKDILLHEDCINADGKGNNCIFFNCYGMIGSRPYVACSYGEPKKDA